MDILYPNLKNRGITPRETILTHQLLNYLTTAVTFQTITKIMSPTVLGTTFAGLLSLSRDNGQQISWSSRCTFDPYDHHMSASGTQPTHTVPYQAILMDCHCTLRISTRSGSLWYWSRNIRLVVSDRSICSAADSITIYLLHVFSCDISYGTIKGWYQHKHDGGIPSISYGYFEAGTHVSLQLYNPKQ